MHDMGTLGGDDSIARGINDNGQVVGYGQITGNSSVHAFLYDDEDMIDLNNLLPANSGWELYYAHGINNLGQIIGWGDINGESHAFLMTPVPEPATVSLLAFGGLALLRKRK